MNKKAIVEQIKNLDKDGGYAGMILPFIESFDGESVEFKKLLMAQIIFLNLLGKHKIDIKYINELEGTLLDYDLSVDSLRATYGRISRGEKPVLPSAKRKK